MITVTQARQRLSEHLKIRPTDTVPIARALGRIAAADVVSGLDIPPSDNSAMDGFAVNSSDLSSDQTVLSVSQRIPAGSSPAALQAGTAARIFTGGVMPNGADAVVIQENCEYSDEQVTVLKPVAAKANVRPLGQDISKGAKVVNKGKKISAIDISLLASIGHSNVAVFQPLTVAIFSTGDELIEPGKPLGVGQIYNSNRPLLTALCEQMGYVVFDCGTVEDTLDATKIALANAAKHADAIISSGGVSVGDEDHVKPAVESLGELSLWKVQMKPGKPVAFGHIDDVPFLGLPGNPVSSFTVFQLLGVPLLQSIQGQDIDNPLHYSIVSSFDKPITTREEYIRVKLVQDRRGGMRVERFPNLSSGVMSSLSWADGLVRQPIDTSIAKGSLVDFFPLREAML